MVSSLSICGTRFAFGRLVKWIELLQWPAMVVTVTAAWLAGSQHKLRRAIGFWAFLGSNALWVVWGWNDHAYALIALQFFLALTNIRGAKKNATTDPVKK